MFKNKKVVYAAGALIASALLLTSCSGGDEATGGKRIGADTTVATKTPAPSSTTGHADNTKDASGVVAVVNAFYSDLYSGDYSAENFEKIAQDLEADISVFSEKYDLSITESDDPSIISSLPEDAQKEYLELVKKHFPIADYFSDSVDLETYTGVVILSISAADGGVFNEDSQITFDEDAVTVDGDKATVDASQAKANMSLDNEYLIGSTADGAIPLVYEDGNWFIDTDTLYDSILSSFTTTSDSETGESTE